jgi:hypothetical protein
VFVAADACAAYEPDLHAGALKMLDLNTAILTDSASVAAAWKRADCGRRISADAAGYQVTADAIAAAISQDEIVELALTLGNIPAPSGEELEVGNFVHDWMAREGFSPRKVGATRRRPNIIGTMAA